MTLAVSGPRCSRRTLLALAALSFAVHASSSVADAHDSENGARARWVRQVVDAWEARKARTQTELRDRLRAKDPYALYDVQLLLQNLLEWAILQRDSRMLGEIGDLLAISLEPGLSDRSPAGQRWWICGSSRCVVFARPAYRNQEVMLCSAQYLSMISTWLAAAVSVPEHELTPTSRASIGEFGPIVRQHLMRWLTIDGYLYRLGQMSRVGPQELPRLRNAILDKDMFIVSMASELLRANRVSPGRLPLSPTEARAFAEVVALGESILERRSSPIALPDGATAYVFDPGYWSEYPDFRHAGYTGADYPDASMAQTVATVGWDSSHFRRMVYLLLALERGREIRTSSFAPSRFMAGYGNAVASLMWNGDARKPLFRNFMDGSNGWYRVGYEGRNGSGYRPWSMSPFILSGGYGLLARHSDAMRARLGELQTMMASGDAEIVAFRAQWGYNAEPVAMLPTFQPLHAGRRP